MTRSLKEKHTSLIFTQLITGMDNTTEHHDKGDAFHGSENSE
jgi:hypothetical protein